MNQDLQSMLSAVSLEGIRAAREVVYQTLQPTPLLEHPLLSETIGTRVFLKHENHLPTGAFKVRGGLNLMSRFAAAPTHNGVISATTGNHGQSIALAATRYSVPATIVVPLGNNPEKNAAMRAFGARLVEHGRDFDEAREAVEQLATQENLRYIHSANEPLLINGVGTYALEIVEKLQQQGEQADAIFVPIGMGSGLCGVITAFRALSPATRIFGVQAEGAPSNYLSWQAGHIVTTPEANTFAEGIATRSPAALTFEILNQKGQGVDEIVLVSDEDMREAIRLLWRTTHNLVEGAGAAATAATLKLRERLSGQTVVNVISGGNLATETLRQVFGTAIA